MKKGPRSLDDYENDDSVNQSDFIKGVMNDKNMAGDSRLSARQSVVESKIADSDFNPSNFEP